MAGIDELSKAARNTLGLPEGFQLYSPAPFGGMNYESSRIGIADQEFWWRENLIRIGDFRLATVPDAGTQLYTSGKVIIRPPFFYFIGATAYCAIFFSDGTAIQVRISDQFVTSISKVPNTFYLSSGTIPACVQWGTSYLVISNNNTKNDYWIWDGTLLYGSGTIGPTVTITDNGRNYSTPPDIIANGGSGSGLVFTSVVQGGGVIEVSVADPGIGYEIGDQIQLQFSGGGSDRTAVLKAILTSGSVSAVNLTAGGSNYTAPTATLSGGGGTGAAVSITLGTGEVTDLTLTSDGSGYTMATVSFTGGGGTGASAIATVVGGQVTALTLTSGGTGYTSDPVVNITGDGIGATANATAAGSGVIALITLTSGGSGYTSPPIITISDPTGSGASAVAFLASGSIQSVQVVDPGTDYITAPTLSVIGGNGTGATLTALLVGTSVAYINVINGGQGIYNGCNVFIQANSVNNPGGGTGATAVAVVQDGTVVQVKVITGGSGYTTAPSVQFELNNKDTQNQEGYTVTTPQATAILTPSVVGSVIVTAPGQGYTQTPGIEVEAGANNSASATVELMPFGTSGASIASFDQRIWLAHPFQQLANSFTNGTLLVSAPESLTDFATSDGGLIYQSSSSFLGAGFSNLAVVGDYLYSISPNSVDVISNVQTSGNPSTTTFNDDNTDPQTGTPWPLTVQNFSRTALMANKLGVYGIYGGAVTKLSKKLDQLFANAVFPPTSGALTPSAAIGTINGQRVYCVLMTITDKVWGGTRNILATWDEQDWFITTQSPALISIGTQNINSAPIAWGTDGHTVWPLFQTATGLNQVRLATKLYGANNFPIVKSTYSVHMAAVDTSTGQSGVAFQTFNIDTENGSFPEESFVPVTFGGKPIIGWQPTPINYGDFIGASMISNSVSFELQHLGLGYANWWSGIGTPPSTQDS